MLKVLISAVILFSFLALLVSSTKAGRSARSMGKEVTLASDQLPVYLAANTADLYWLWKEQHVRCRVVVHLGKYLHFVEPDSPAGYRVSQMYPLQVEKLPDPKAPVTNRNVLWSAMQSNFIREVYHVLPQPEFRKRFSAGEGTAGGEVKEQSYGSKRIITTRIPAVAEPVLLDVDASFFSSMDVPAVLKMLKESGLAADLVAVSLAEDNMDVSSLERERARSFARSLSPAGAIVIPPGADGKR